MGVFFKQYRTQLAGKLHRIHRERFIAALCHHFKGMRLLQVGPQILHRNAADLVKIFCAHRRAGQCCNAKHFLHTAKGFVNINIVAFRLDIHGALRVVHAKLAKVCKAAAHSFHHRLLKGFAVEAFQRHFALIGHNQFFHLFHPLTRRLARCNRI
ncbi:hypothetical protein SDC9_148907 [bioreactor metagenome]|uniref:Uncharacterized protein n=1 Tax=bioreactor metagenome TaxID=1076179 RepID=A0A645EJS5_9ZZZZ